MVVGPFTIWTNLPSSAEKRVCVGILSSFPFLHSPLNISPLLSGVYSAFGAIKKFDDTETISGERKIEKKNPRGKPQQFLPSTA
jgi:hypothetical protein